jgi:hypothetical protein
MLAGRGESQRVMQVGLSQASVLARKINSFGDPRLYAINEVADKLSHSEQPLVPQRLFITQGGGDQSTPQGTGLLGALISLLVAEKSGFHAPEVTEPAALQSLVDELSTQAVENIKQSMSNGSVIAGKG